MIGKCEYLKDRRSSLTVRAILVSKHQSRPFRPVSMTRYHRGPIDAMQWDDIWCLVITLTQQSRYQATFVGDLQEQEMPLHLVSQ